MHVPSLIEKKREGQELTADEIGTLVADFTAGKVPDYQMSAWAMAVLFRGMTAEETRHLTHAMMNSGRVLQYPENSPPRIDKHSTGGIGDKTSIVLAPLLACDEAWVPMISGRGLGITGGTLDKLESIPGFNVNLDEERALDQLRQIRLFVIGQTEDICPADKKLYALRDVTGTVPSQALIVASIMSKKLAENLNRLVLDVKYGSGAFMKNQAEAEQLAQAMTSVGELMGVKMSHLLTPMEEPLGNHVGNALEIAECVETLQGRGPADLVKLVLDLAEKVSETPREKLAKRLHDGSAWKKLVSLVYAQDGDATTLEIMMQIHAAPVIKPVTSKSSGILKKMDAGAIGRAAVLLGAGRQKSGDPIDFAVGISSLKKTGAEVATNEPLMFVHARTESSFEQVRPMLEQAAVVE